MKSVIFDLDGTLADTSGDLIAAANACFDGLGHGLLLDPKTDMLTAFHGGRAMLRLGFSRLEQPWDESMVDAQYDELLRHYGENIAVHTRLYPNVEQALEELKSRGYLLGVCTNKPEALAETLMAQLGVRSMFGALLGADTLPVRKPDPDHLWETIRRVGGDLKRSVLIGDTDNDRSAARNANVPSVLVTFGPSGHGVAEMEPEALLHHYDDLPDLVDRLVQ
ncbi:HAD hydrolase-like protein [Neptunicoccus cionae]|uniref:HAD hydrolase-like protein n=1 Tax=Neptunicoccus cionae TaxID=2035344 RepID=UPI000C76C247|nr:HAD hydrolase-like protein [Amylibacter cionae]PLS22129.1 haloacid dehalogenase [Amylibacter cionae]